MAPHHSGLAGGFQDGYFQDEAGIHHRVLAAMLETPPGEDCYGMVEVFEDRLRLVGEGALASTDMPLGVGPEDGDGHLVAVTVQ
jgi:hypothetical protein